MIVQNQGVVAGATVERKMPDDLVRRSRLCLSDSTHGLMVEKIRGRQGERTTTPQTIERSTKNQALDILEYLLTKFLRSISGIKPNLSCCLATRFW